MTGMHASLVYGLNEDDLVTMLTVQGAVHPERLVALGDPVARRRRYLFRPRRCPGRASAMQKALRLYLEAWERSDALRYETIPGLDATITWIDGYPVTAQTRRLLMDYLEEKGRFDEAENYVLDWAEGGTEDALTYASDFYQRLLGLWTPSSSSAGSPATKSNRLSTTSNSPERSSAPCSGNDRGWPHPS